MAGKAVVINSSTGTGASVSFTSSGFGTPTGALILWSGATSSNADTQHAVMATTYWDGTNTVTISTAGEDNQAKTDTNVGITDDVYLINGTTTLDARGTISATTDGITINWSDQPGSDWKCTVVLFGGDCTCFAGHILTSGTNNGTVSETGCSFTAQIGIFSSHGNNGWNQVNQGGLLPSLGAFTYQDSTINQRCFAYFDGNNANDSAVNAVARNNAVAIGINEISSAYFTVTTVESNGFTLTSTGTLGRTLGYLLIGGLNSVSLDDTAMPASTGTTSFTGPGFEPDLILNVQTGLPAYNTSYSTEDINVTVGVSDGTTTGGIAAYATDGAATTDTANRHNTTLGTSDQTTAAEQWNYTLDSFDADGYNFDYTEVGTSGDIGFTLAIQFESAVTPITGYWAMDGVFEL